MKHLLTIYIFVILATVYTIFMLVGCNPLTGDNKVSQVDSAPKPQLNSFSLRTDVPPVFTNKFSGIVQLIEKNLFDTVTYKLYVDNKFVRVDKFLKNSNYESLIINLEKKEITILNHNKQLYSTIKVDEEKMEYDSSIKIIKTENERTILERNCKQWRVKNLKENTEITYWVDCSDYGYYYYLIKIWNATAKTHKYFQIIPNSFGCMPLEIVERNLLRDVKSTINITTLEFSSIDQSLFNIPTNYSAFFY